MLAITSSYTTVEVCNLTGNLAVSYIVVICEPVLDHRYIDGLYRDGTVHISREMHKHNSPRNDQRSAKTSQTSLTDLSLAIGTRP